jgi:2-hydroxychromene-2-carboxylate isomerase
MNLTTGINVWAKTTIRHGGFPFELSDPFFSEANLARLALSKKQIADGNIIYKTDQELGLDDDVLLLHSDDERKRQQHDQYIWRYTTSAATASYET